jgi:hypothetical protein
VANILKSGINELKSTTLESIEAPDLDIDLPIETIEMCEGF